MDRVEFTAVFTDRVEFTAVFTDRVEFTAAFTDLVELTVAFTGRELMAESTLELISEFQESMAESTVQAVVESTALRWWSCLYVYRSPLSLWRRWHLRPWWWWHHGPGGGGITGGINIGVLGGGGIYGPGGGGIYVPGGGGVYGPGGIYGPGMGPGSIGVGPGWNTGGGYWGNTGGWGAGANGQYNAYVQQQQQQQAIVGETNQAYGRAQMNAQGNVMANQPFSKTTKTLSTRSLSGRWIWIWWRIWCSIRRNDVRSRKYRSPLFNWWLRWV